MVDWPINYVLGSVCVHLVFSEDIGAPIRKPQGCLVWGCKYPGFYPCHLTDRYVKWLTCRWFTYYLWKMVVFHSYLRLPEGNYQGSRYGSYQVFGHLSNCLVSWHSQAESKNLWPEVKMIQPTHKVGSSNPLPLAHAELQKALWLGLPPINQKKQKHQTVNTSCPMTDTNVELFPALPESPNHPTNYPGAEVHPA